MWSFDSFKIAFDVVYWVIKSKDDNPIKSTGKAKKITRNFYEKICPKYWINVEYTFGEDSFNDFPEIVDEIKEYIEKWTLPEKSPLLWLWNHQAFWLEAVWAYDYFPTTWKIVLKDDLVKPPLFWDAILDKDPIIHYRNDKNLEKIRHDEIIKQILEKKAILIFPEWTRSKDWNLWNFKSSLFKPAFDTIKSNTDKISQKIAIITADTFPVFPSTLENSILFMWEINPWTIKYTIDIIDISLYSTARGVNKVVRNIIQNNLNN